MNRPTGIPGWLRALAVILGLLVMGIGFTIVFVPAIVVGLVTFMFSISFIAMGIWALVMGISGERVTLTQSVQPTSQSRQSTNRPADQQKVS